MLEGYKEREKEPSIGKTQNQNTNQKTKKGWRRDGKLFVGDEQEAIDIVNMGFHLGIGGVVTFKNSTLRDHLAKVPKDRIVVETDSPYLAPTPYRGKRNESAYVMQVVRELSYIYNVPENEVIEFTTANALKLFNL